MGIVQNIIGMVRDINDRKRGAKVEDALRNYFDNPVAAMEQVQQIDPVTGIKMRGAYEDRQATQAKAKREAATGDMDLVGKYLRGLDPKTTDYDATFEQLTPFFTGMGVDPERVGALRAAVKANPMILQSADDTAWKQMAKDKYSTTVITPGSIGLRGGEPVARAPFAMKTVTTRGGDGSARTDAFDPNTGEWNGQGAGFALPGAPAPATGTGQKFSGKLDVETVRPHIKAQETNDDYTAVNPDTGALGAYQVMPATGRALAKRLGLAWRPDMMRKDDPASRRYQDAIGGAAIEEAIGASGGDPMTMAQYYHGGSNRKIWGSRTQKYGNEVVARLSGGAPAPAGQGGVTMPGRTPKQVRAASPQEIAAAGYPAGTAAQVDETGKFVNIKTPSAAAAKNAPAAQIEKATSLYDTMDRLQGFASDVLNSPGLDTATGVIAGRAPGWMLGQEGQNFINSIDNLKRNIGLAELMKFKATSSQGASGFGNLSNEEGKRLESAYGVLERTSDPSVIRSSLKTILDITQKVKERQQGFIRQQGGGGGEAPPGTIVKMPNGTRQIKTPQGWRPYNG